MIAIVARFWGTSGRAPRRFTPLSVTICMLAALSGCAWWDTKERELVYRPSPGKQADFKGLRPGDDMYSLDVPGEVTGTPEHIEIWWMPKAGDPQAPTLLYLHGTFRSLYKNYPKIEALRDAGFAVMAVDYRGWGESSPIVPSEKTILADANSAWLEFARRQPDPRKRVIFGHSMGGAVAINLAVHKHYLVDYAALITESTFTSLPAVAASVGTLGTIASWITRQRFDSLDKIGEVDAPILMLHGQQDNTVPVELGRKLRDAARPGVRWLEVPGGTHSSMHEEAPELYRQAIKSVINQLPKTSPPAAAAHLHEAG